MGWATVSHSKAETDPFLMFMGVPRLAGRFTKMTHHDNLCINFMLFIFKGFTTTSLLLLLVWNELGTTCSHKWNHHSSIASISYSVGRYAKSVGAKHFHTSAKLNQGIEEMFLELSHRMIERAMENDQQKASSLGRSGSTRRNVVVVEDEEAAQPKSGCCGGVSAAS